MTVRDLIEKGRFNIINQGALLDQEITTPFCCDLLSFAMSKAPAKAVWVTVMGNVNTLAVAKLVDIPCIILAEGTELDNVAREKAKTQDITVLNTDGTIFDTALTVYQWIHGVYTALK